MKLLIVAAAYALWLTGIDVVFWMVHSQDLGALEYAVLAGVAPAGLQIVLLGFNPVGLARPALLMATLLLIVLLSDLFNSGDWTAVTYVIELIYISSVTLVVAGCSDHRLLRRVAAIYAVLSALFLIYVDITGEYVWGRLVAHDVESNFWGLMGLSVAVAAFGLRSRLLATFCIVAGMATIYVASSRSSMLGLATALGAIGICHLIRLRNRQLMLTVGAGGALLVLVVLLTPYLRTAVPAFFDDLFKLDDPYRGLGQGFTGRDVLWRAAIDIWWQNPWFGVGFRQHEQFLPLGFSAHNAYLAMLADTGIFGLAWYLILLAGAGIAVFGVAETRTRNVVIGLVASYIIIGFFERRAINGANPMSLLFLMACFLALQEHSLRSYARRVARAGGRADGIPLVEQVGRVVPARGAAS